MNTFDHKTRGTLFFLALFFLVTLLPAQDAKGGIKERMKGRFAKINDLKKSGKIGETPQGFLEAVKPKSAGDSAIVELLTAENNDRKLLYGLIGKDSETSEEEVGITNAKRIFQKAPETDYFKSADGVWKKKKNMTVEK